MNEHNKEYGFYSFNLTQNRALELYSTLLASIIHFAWCDGGHPIPNEAIKYTKAVIIPALRISEKWSQDTIKERDYIFFLLGVILTQAKDLEYCDWMIAGKQDTYENTLLYLLKEGKDMFADENAPLN